MHAAVVGSSGASSSSSSGSGARSSSSSGNGGGAAAAAASGPKSTAAAAPAPPTAAAAATSSGSQPQQQQHEQRQQQNEQPPIGGAAAGRLAADPALLRRAAAARSAVEALDLLLHADGAPAAAAAAAGVSAADAELLIGAALEKGNVELALAVYAEMCAARRSGGGGIGGIGGIAGMPASGIRSSAAGAGGPAAWPAATLATTAGLVLGLCRQLRVAEAVAVVQGVRSQGVPRNEEVAFGFVVPSPLPPRRPLAVVQPQEGAKVVADSATRYEFELFSGTVASVSSEAQQPAGNWALAAARAAGLWRAPPVAAVHTWAVRAPDGMVRTFRAATATADVPAAVGDRVTVVAAPERGRGKARRLLLTTAPPGLRPGEPVSVVNHRTGAELLLGRPPPPGQSGALPGWALPALVLLAGSDAASALIDPALPALIAAGAAATVGSAVAGNQLLLPRLKQLPGGAVKVEAMRQALLAQHAALSKKAATALQEAGEDVRALARLWQLQVKMEAVGGGAGSSGGGSPAGGLASSSSGASLAGSLDDAASGAPAAGGAVGAYAARIGRVEAARAGVEARLASRLELLDGYARVLDMIEIEVEMEADVAAAEVADGIGAQVERLAELEALQEEWRAQAEAQDEVERLLRA